MLVLVGTLIGGLLSVPVTAFGDFLQQIWVSLKPRPSNLSGLIVQIAAHARLQRVSNIRERSAGIEAVENPFLRRGLQQVLDNQDRKEVEESMEKEISLYLSRLDSHLATIRTFVRLAPVFGFVGTIIGLINVLNNMGDATQIGHGMAIALLTTFYGLLLANFLFAPLAGKLAAHIQRETLMVNIVIEGVAAICDQRTPLEISYRLQAYIETDGKATDASTDPRFWRKMAATLNPSGLAR
jgi:chemotaxis protein MotA